MTENTPVSTNKPQGGSVPMGKPVASSFVTVTRMSGGKKQVDWSADATVADYLKQADITVGQTEVVTLNGTGAKLNQKVEPNSVLVVAPNIDNG